MQHSLFGYRALQVLLLATVLGGRFDRSSCCAGQPCAGVEHPGRRRRVGQPGCPGACVVFGPWCTEVYRRQRVVAGIKATGEVRFIASRIGYSDVDTTLTAPVADEPVVIRLERSAVSLPALTVQAERDITSRELNRLMFDREVTIGSIGMTRADLKAVPAVIEPDVFRSLQAFAGVSSVTDYTGQLFVRGGASDQVATLYDGAPVFGPYHMFGLFGMFNVDAVESTEFYRGSIPARYGGALSGVVNVRPRIGRASKSRISGGLSLLGARVLADGPLPWGGDTRWMVGGRSSLSEIVGSSSSYVFRDFNFGLQTNPSDTHRLRFSLVTSTDDFAWGLVENRPARTLRSDWANVASSLTWSWVPSDRLLGEATTYYSKYRGMMRIGTSPGSPSTHSEISAIGFRVGVTAKGNTSGARAGLAAEIGDVDLLGQGGYLYDATAGSYLHLSAFGEAEHWFGPVRLAPGIRTSTETRSSRWFVEPRFGRTVRERSSCRERNS